MRLKDWQIQVIREQTQRVFGSKAQTWLFGSRVDDKAKGGDIDLYVEVAGILENKASAICAFDYALVRAMGDRKLDIVVCDKVSKPQEIFRVAKLTGVQL